jgi:hypothetical protein
MTMSYKTAPKCASTSPTPVEKILAALMRADATVQQLRAKIDDSERRAKAESREREKDRRALKRSAVDVA